jgi:hypothetical protein
MVCFGGDVWHVSGFKRAFEETLQIYQFLTPMACTKEWHITQFPSLKQAGKGWGISQKGSVPRIEVVSESEGGWLDMQSL